METRFRWKRGRIATAIAVAAVLGVSSAAAQVPDRGGETNAGRFYAFGGFALFAPDKNDQFRGEHGGVGLTGGGGFRLTPLLSFELGVLGTGYRIDTPASASAQLPVGTFKDGTLRTNIGTGGLNLAVKFHFTVDRVEPYFAVGVGRYTTSFRTTSEALTCERRCADTGPRVTSRSRDTGYHAAIGADYHLRAKDVIAVEFRHLKLDANFDDIGLGNVKAGGSLLWLGYRRYF